MVSTDEIKTTSETLNVPPFNLKLKQKSKKIKVERKWNSWISPTVSKTASVHILVKIFTSTEHFLLFLKVSYKQIVYEYTNCFKNYKTNHSYYWLKQRLAILKTRNAQTTIRLQNNFSRSKFWYGIIIQCNIVINNNDSYRNSWFTKD